MKYVAWFVRWRYSVCVIILLATVLMVVLSFARWNCATYAKCGIYMQVLHLYGY